MGVHPASTLKIEDFARSMHYLDDGVEVENQGFHLKLVADGTKVICLGLGELRALARVATV